MIKVDDVILIEDEYDNPQLVVVTGFDFMVNNKVGVKVENGFSDIFLYGACNWSPNSSTKMIELGAL